MEYSKIRPRMLIAVFFLIALSSANAQPTVLWQKTYGGGTASATDKSVVKTTDGGYIVAGYSAKNDVYHASLKKLDAFTMSLSVNLEPLYSIILAIILFHEDKMLNSGFYVGSVIIILSVVVHGVYRYRKAKKKAEQTLLGT